MFIPELASLDLQEAQDLPPKTLVAPLTIIREIRCALGECRLNLLVGQHEHVRISSDLFAAFQAWEAAQEDEEQDGADDVDYRLN